MFTGDLAEGRVHLDKAMAIYNPAEHRPLATRFGQDIRVVILSLRSWALWSLGYPDAARADADDAVKDAREVGQAATLMYALRLTPSTHLWSGNYVAAADQAQELVALAEQKGASMWKASGMMDEGFLLALTGKASHAVQMITSGINAWPSTGATLNTPMFLTYLARAYTELGQFEQAWRSIDEAIAVMENTKEILWEPEVHRTAGEIALRSPEPDAAKVRKYFDRALSVARQRQAKSCELRAAMSLARLWRDQGKTQEARELLAPVYGWFTEGFDTLDLKEAKALLDELRA